MLATENTALIACVQIALRCHRAAIMWLLGA